MSGPAHIRPRKKTSIKVPVAVLPETVTSAATVSRGNQLDVTVDASDSSPPQVDTNNNNSSSSTTTSNYQAVTGVEEEQSLQQERTSNEQYDSVSSNRGLPVVSSILRRNPKYSTAQQQSKRSDNVDTNPSNPLQQESPQNSSTAVVAPIAVVQDVIVERTRPTKISSHMDPPSGTTSTAVEGYLPKFNTNPFKKFLKKQPTSSSPTSVHASSSKRRTVEGVPNTGSSLRKSSESDSDDGSGLVFDSLSELMEHAGTLPSQQQGNEPLDTHSSADPPIPPGSLVEADLSFQVMDPETFAQQQANGASSLRDRTNMGDDEDFDDVVEDPEHEITTVSDDDDDDDNEEELFRILRENRDEDEYYSDDDEPDDLDQQEEVGGLSGNRRPMSLTQPRPFLTLWKALSQWVTPQAVLYLRHSEISSTPFEPRLEADSDIVASRCAGLYAMLQLHIRSALRELQYTHNIRLAQVRLSDLLRCFDYSQPMPQLDTPHIKALTYILLHTVLLHQDGFVDIASASDAHITPSINGSEQGRLEPRVPDSCGVLGLSLEEYRNLTRALLNFGLPEDDGQTVENPQAPMRNGMHNAQQ